MIDQIALDINCNLYHMDCHAAPGPNLAATSASAPESRVPTHAQCTIIETKRSKYT